MMYPPWFDERAQRRMVRFYLSCGISVRRVAWISGLPEREVHRLVAS